MVNDFFEKLMESRKHKKEFVEKMSYSTEYIDWLESFTEKHGSFSTDSFLYGDELSEEEKVNVQDVQILYEEIQDYCDSNYIVPTIADFGAFYSIKHNGIGYFIGIDTGQGTSFYCTRLDEPEEDALEFKHVMSSVKLPKTIRDEYLLEELSELIECLYDKGVSVQAISETTENAIQKVKTKSDDDIKSKKKNY